MVDLVSLLSKYMERAEAEDTAKRWSTYIEKVYKKHDVEVYYREKAATKYNQLIVVKDIHVISCCPHHLLPVAMRVHIGYLPDGDALGHSKFIRVARALASPRFQEDYTEHLVDSIMSGLEPKWTMAVVQGRHQCMSCRGVFAEDASVITSAARRSKSPDSTEERGERLKQEFLKLIAHSL